jgi:hypothetical protein
VRDLPSYTNRVIQRRRKLRERVYSSIVAVSKPNFTPIAIASREYPPQFPQAAPTQIFITTLERQYTGIKSADLQQFHWLFLAKTKLGWRLFIRGLVVQIVLPIHQLRQRSKAAKAVSVKQ